MAKCIRCGGSFLLHKKVKLQDAEICSKCFYELGFDKGYLLISNMYPYEKIKDGIDAYYENERKNEGIEAAKEKAIRSVSVGITNYGQERDLICTEEERAIFEELELMVDGMDLPAPLQLVRVSDNYVSAKIGDWDLARIKYTNRAKWILFPTVERSDAKHPLEDTSDVTDLEDIVAESVEHIVKYF